MTDAEMLDALTPFYIGDVQVEFDIEIDGQWIAEVQEIPGALVYGANPVEAIVNLMNLLCEMRRYTGKPGRPREYLWDGTTVNERRHNGDLRVLLEVLLDPWQTLRRRKACALAVRELAAKRWNFGERSVAMQMLYNFAHAAD